MVFSPFMGIGSEGVASLSMGRKFMGTRLHLGLLPASGQEH